MTAYENSRFLPEPEAESSAAKSLDGEPSAPSSLIPTPLLFCAPDKTKAFSRLSRSGMTCASLTADRGADLLTWYRADFLARIFPLPAKEPESTAKQVDFGAKCTESFAKYDRASSSWKTPQPSLFADLAESSVTWPRQGTMRNGACWARTMLAPRTNANESGSGQQWPTPRASENDQGRGADAMADGVSSWKAQGRGATLTTAVARWQTPLADAILRWPTPTASDGAGGPGRTPKRTGGDNLRTAIRFPTPTCQDADKATKKMRDGHQNNLTAVVFQDFPTPTSRDHKGGYRTESLIRNDGKSRAFDALPNAVLNGAGAETVSGQLNPDWVELLMGWPRGWTSLAPLDAGDFDRWLAVDHWRADWEDGTPRIGSGIVSRAARLKAIGNGQVAICAASAWNYLRFADTDP